MNPPAFTNAARTARAAGCDARGSAHDRLRGLLDAHFDFVWRSLRRLGVPELDADDAAQNVFLVAARKLERIEEGSERGFLFGTAVRVASDMRRSRRRRRETEGIQLTERPDESPRPDEQVDEIKARACLDRILGEMPIELSSIFILFEIEELESTQIAAMLGLPVGTVASRLRRAREDFRQRAVRLRARMGLK